MVLNVHVPIAFGLMEFARAYCIRLNGMCTCPLHLAKWNMHVPIAFGLMECARALCLIPEQNFCRGNIPLIETKIPPFVYLQYVLLY